jgi:CTP:molybdopterin cytidylyltransferase MocA
VLRGDRGRGAEQPQGRFKPLLPFAGTTIAARCVRISAPRAWRRSSWSPAIANTELRAALAGADVRFCSNPDYRTTQMFDSLRIGLAALPGGVRACSSPRRTSRGAAGDGARAAGDGGRGGAALCGGRPGHPILLDRSLVPGLLAHDGAGGLRARWTRSASALPICRRTSRDFAGRGHAGGLRGAAARRRGTHEDDLLFPARPAWPAFRAA